MAVLIATAAWAVGSAVVSGVMANREVRNKNTQLLEAAARRDASIDISVGMQQEGMTAEAAQVMQAFQTNQLRIDNSAQATQAANKVEAAASGAAGQSVEITKQAVDASAGKLQGDLSNAQDMALLNLEKKFRDIEIQGAAQQQEVILDNEKTGVGIATLLQNMARLQSGFSVGGGTEVGGGFQWGGDLEGFF